MNKLKKIICILVFAIIVPSFVLVYATLHGEQNGSFGSDLSFATEETDVNVSKNSSNSLSETPELSSVLTIDLSGDYLKAYTEAVKSLSNSYEDLNKKLVTKIGLQILQSKTIKYENALHFYNLSYSSSGGTKNAKFYDLKDCIDRINSGKTIYTDCFGFVRLTYSIACFSQNSENPELVVGLSELYGYKGSYTGASITSLGKLNCGSVIYDRLTGSGSTTNRHVAMFLYASGDNVTYMDQGGVFMGVYKDSSHIYSTAVSKPYKFNTYKNYV